MKFVVFKIEDEEYGIDIEYVKGIEDKVTVVSVPNRPKYVLGIINLRGEVIPVFSIRVKFGKDEVNEDLSRLVIVSLNEEQKIALKVDEVTKIIDVEEKDLHDIPFVCKCETNKYAKNVAKVDNKLVIMMDLDNIVEEEQLEQLQKAVEDSMR